MRARTRRIAVRLAGLLAVLLAVSLLTFLLLELLPGDPALAIVGSSGTTTENLEAVRRSLRLDDPLLVRFVRWLGGALTGDLGTSFRSRQPVTTAIGAALPITLQLAATAFVISLVAIPLAVVAAGLRRRSLEWAISAVPLALLATPSFVLAIVLIWLFSVTLGWLPATGWTRLTADLSSNLRSSVLPSLTLAAGNVGVLMRVLNSELVTSLQQDYVTVARSKGLTRWQVIRSHALRPALLPLITVLGLQGGAMIAGAVIVESVFGLPGMGRLLVESIYQRDLITVQGVVLVMASAYVIVNALVDVAYTRLDPRLRDARG